MTMRSTPPFLIVGQGLAGSLLAHGLDRLGADFRVIDPGGATPCASRAAAGLLNPYTGPRYKAPQPAEVWFRAAVSHWRLLEHRLTTPLLHLGTLYRLFRDSQERDRAMARTRETVRPQIRVQAAPAAARLRAPLGCAAVEAGQVDLPAFVDATRHWLRQSDRLIEEAFNPEDMDADTTARPQWRGHPIRALVLCAGHRARDWPWFHPLPWRMSHGQALILERTTGLGPHMLSRGKNLVPIDEQRAWFGATYDRYSEPTRDEGGRNQLLEALRDCFETAPDIRILEQVAGVRAGNREGLLFCGAHPTHPRLYLFGGLGSRGTLIAPPAATALASHLVSGTPLPRRWSLAGYFAGDGKP